MSKTMTTNELTGRELDAAIAIVMGAEWRILKHPNEPNPTTALAMPGSFYFINPHWRKAEPDEVNIVRDSYDAGGIPHYSTDIAAAFELQAELEQRGLGPQYAEVLDEGMGCSLIGLEGKVLEDGVFVEYSDVFRLISATAEQRARAALKVLQRAN